MPCSGLRVYLLLLIKVNCCLHLSNALLLLLQEATKHEQQLLLNSVSAGLRLCYCGGTVHHVTASLSPSDLFQLVLGSQEKHKLKQKQIEQGSE